jgi:hypothetical protein
LRGRVAKALRERAVPVEIGEVAAPRQERSPL